MLFLADTTKNITILDSLLVLVLGMLIIFAVLALLIFVVKGYVGFFSLFSKKDKKEKVEKKVEITKTIKAPAKKGEIVGEVIYMMDGEELGRVGIALSEDMEKANWFTLLVRRILAFFGLE